MKADQLLVEEAKKGERAAFSELVGRHQKSLLRLAVRMTRDLEHAEDIVQDSFIKAYQKLHLFEGRSSFKSWLFQIAINTAKNKMRPYRPEQIDLEKANLSVDPRAEMRLEDQEVHRLLRDEVDRLPSKQKMAISLRVFEDLSFKEIAEIMECPYDTAKANYRHALMKLRHRFQQIIAHKPMVSRDFVVSASLEECLAEVKG